MKKKRTLKNLCKAAIWITLLTSCSNNLENQKMKFYEGCSYSHKQKQDSIYEQEKQDQLFLRILLEMQEKENEFNKENLGFWGDEDSLNYNLMELFSELCKASVKTNNKLILSNMIYYLEEWLCKSDLLEEEIKSVDNCVYRIEKFDRCEFAVYTIMNTGFAREIHESKENCQIISLWHSIIFDIIDNFQESTRIQTILKNINEYLALSNIALEYKNIQELYNSKNVIYFFNSEEVQFMMKTFLESMIHNIRITFNKDDIGITGEELMAYFNKEELKNYQFEIGFDLRSERIIIERLFRKNNENKFIYFGLYKLIQKGSSQGYHTNSLNLRKIDSDDFEKDLQSILSTMNKLCGIGIPKVEYR